VSEEAIILLLHRWPVPPVCVRDRGVWSGAHHELSCLCEMT